MPDRLSKPEHKRLSGATQPEDKICNRCGRAFSWRKKWERDWVAVQYCSDACRGQGLSALDAALESAILQLLQERERGKTICPSEAALLVGSGTKVVGGSRAATRHEWEPLMEPARAAARRLVAAGTILITQGGRVVDPSTAKGPIRLRLR